jgi:hypothetical protein
MSSAEGQEKPVPATGPSEAAPAGSPAAPKKKKKKLRPAPKPPMTEEEINSPTNQTIGMLSIIGIMTFVMWVFARGGCNYHPPKETRDPRQVDLVELARDPKDAAMEFELRWSGKKWGGALELAKGPLLERVKQEQRTCDADPRCAQRASDLRGKVLVSAELLEREPTRAVARIITTGTGPNPERHIIRVEREQQVWKAISREVDDGSFKPRPQPVLGVPVRDGALLLRQPGMPGTTPAPSASASAEPAKK